MLPLMVDGRDTRERRRAAEGLIEETGLSSRIDALAEELSGGEQQRTAVLRCIVTEPAIILADEPTGNLDSERAEHVFKMVCGATHDRGAGVLMATHDHLLAARCDRVVAMLDGMIVGTKRIDGLATDARVNAVHQLMMRHAG